MVLTVTLTAGFAVDEGRAGVRELLMAAIGCNVAWGVIDAAMYLMDAITVRTGKMRLVTAVQGASSSAAALALIRDEIEPELQELLDPSEREAFSTSVFRHISRAQATTKILTRDDVYGALACFVLVFLSSLPAVLPFLFFLPSPILRSVSPTFSLSSSFLLSDRSGRLTWASIGWLAAPS